MPKNCAAQFCRISGDLTRRPPSLRIRAPAKITARVSVTATADLSCERALSGSVIFAGTLILMTTSGRFGSRDERNRNYRPIPVQCQHRRNHSHSRGAAHSYKAEYATARRAAMVAAAHQPDRSRPTGRLQWRLPDLPMLGFRVGIDQGALMVQSPSNSKLLRRNKDAMGQQPPLRPSFCIAGT